MLHCFGCGKDLPDNLAYCLYCGAPLQDDDEPTVVHPPPPAPEPIVYERRRGSGIGKFILGSLLGGLLVILLLVIGAVVLFSFMKNDDDKGTNQAVNIAPTASPTPVKSPSSRKASPSPTPAGPNDNTDVRKSSERECRIINPAGGSVNLRRNCDTRDCSMDESTLYAQAQPGDTVIPTGKPSVTTGRFTWVQVRYRGENVWISSSRMSCEQ